MICQNEKMSVRQLIRTVLTEEIGIACLMAGYLAGEMADIRYIWVFFLGMLISEAFLWISMDANRRIGGNTRNNKYFRILTGIRYSIMAAVGIVFLYKLISYLLLGNTNGFIIFIAIIIFVYFLQKVKIEERGRCHEILSILAFIPLIILLTTAATKIDFDLLREQWERSEYNVDLWHVALWLSTLGLLVYHERIITISDKLEISKNELEEKRLKRIYICPVIVWGLAAAVYMICLGTLGENSSFVGLMDIGGIPGGILGRQEAFIAIFLIISLASYISGMFSYLRVTLGKKKRLIGLSFGLATVLAFFAIVGVMGAKELFSGEIIGAKEIEEWDFVMSICIDEKGNVITEISGEDESNYYEYGATNLKKLEKEHMLSGRKSLDFSHLKAVVFIDMDEDDMKKWVKEMNADIRISGNVLVFKANNTGGLRKNIKDYENEDVRAVAELGKDLERIGGNNDKYKNSCLYKAGIDMGNIKKIDLSRINLY